MDRSLRRDVDPRWEGSATRDAAPAKFHGQQRVRGTGRPQKGAARRSTTIAQTQSAMLQGTKPADDAFQVSDHGRDADAAGEVVQEGMDHFRLAYLRAAATASPTVH
jgi:hypothetical protein